MAEEPEQGHLDAHTRAAAAPAPGDSAPAPAPIEGGGEDPVDLVAGSPDLGDRTLLAVAAELVAVERRGRGRPRGAANRKNRDMIAYVEALGLSNPWVTLARLHSADTRVLANMLGKPYELDGKPVLDSKGDPIIVPADPLAVLAVQERAATTLMKYHHAQMPQQLELPIKGQRPAIYFGDGATVAIMTGNGSASADFLPPEKPNEINGDFVRHEPDKSHDAGLSSPANGLGGESG